MSTVRPINTIPGILLPLTVYGYAPKQGFNIFAAVAWGVLLVAHIWWLATKKITRLIQAYIVFGCIGQVIGYAIRAQSSNNPSDGDLFIAQYVLIHSSFIFFIFPLVNAVTLAKAGTSPHSDVKGNNSKLKMLGYVHQAFNALILVLIVIGSTLFALALARSFALQPSGVDGGAARNALIASQALQIVSLLAILGMITHLMVHTGRSSTGLRGHGGTGGLTTTDSRATTTTAVEASAPTAARAISKLFLGIAFLTAGMLLMRACYRLGETIEGAPAWTSELLFGLFEFAATWVAVLIWAIRPFATLLTPASAHHNLRDGLAQSNKVRV